MTTTTDLLGVIAAIDGGFPGDLPEWQASITPTSDTTADYVLTRWQTGPSGVLGERLEVARFRVTVEALPREEGDPVPPVAPDPEPDPVEAAIAELDSQLPPETSEASVAELSVPATRVVLNAARTAR